jgi:signal transduction histidine kinase
LLARADSGPWTLERRPVDLAQLATETADSVAILAEERGVRLCVETPEERGACWAMRGAAAHVAEESARTASMGMLCARFDTRGLYE